ncbi:hypothetical protein [Vibrio sp. D431a]|uniref:hypothetical protein n=1 Tax=Vibrio sp. D431a TaxID=2837388 RepID=UPI002552EE0F|nr:hypothetical protein [Vibrio sp. D431a]MDK9793818.1 hypothetical protein [Vibrio sp. D431a]
MILEDITKTFVLVPAAGIDCNTESSLDSIVMNSSHSSIIESLIQTPFFSDCAYFTSVIFDSEQAELFKTDYFRAYKKCNDLNAIYQRKGHITAPVNKITKEILQKNVK